MDKRNYFRAKKNDLQGTTQPACQGAELHSVHSAKTVLAPKTMATHDVFFPNTDALLLKETFSGPYKFTVQTLLKTDL